MGNIEHRIESADLHPGAGLFEGLSHGGLLDGLTVLHESRRDGPQTMARFNGPPAEQDPPLPLGNTAGHDFGVLVVDLPANITDMPLSVIPLGYPEADRGGTLAAEFHIWAVWWLANTIALP